MTLANCKECGGLFLMQRSVYCEECKRELEDYYFRLREYLKAHPRCSVMEAHRQTGIPLAKLLDFQKEEFVPFSK